MELSRSILRRPRWPLAVRSVASLAWVVIATGVAVAFEMEIAGSGFVVLLVGVMLATWSGGLAVGLIATIVSAGSLDYFVLPPRLAFEPTDPDHAARFVAFIVGALIVGTLYNRTRRAQRAAEALAKERGESLAAESHARTRLEDVVEELRVANAVKDEFLALLSHEIKTPIAIIMVNAEVVRRHAGVPPSDRESLDEIVTEGDRLSRIIDNLLALARPESHEVRSEPVALKQLIDRVIERHRSGPNERRFAVRVPHSVVVDGQPLYIDQVVENLVSNAEKYSPAATPITISAYADDGRATICVADRGVGISDDELRHLFSPFYRSSRTEDSVPGLGLGMAVCKRLVEAQSGKIWIEERNGGGTNVYFSLRLIEVEPEVTQARNAATLAGVRGA